MDLIRMVSTRSVRVSAKARPLPLSRGITIVFVRTRGTYVIYYPFWSASGQCSSSLNGLASSHEEV
jgi:hypothetical protein